MKIVNRPSCFVMALICPGSPTWNPLLEYIKQSASRRQFKFIRENSLSATKNVKLCVFYCDKINDRNSAILLSNIYKLSTTFLYIKKRLSFVIFIM